MARQQAGEPDLAEQIEGMVPELRLGLQSSLILDLSVGFATFFAYKRSESGLLKC